MVSLDHVKLIVWDLDETLWSGTLSEGGSSLPIQNEKLLRDLTDCGIINSICSKNEFEPTKKFLQKLGIWDLFVFPSINWESKGPQLKDKIDKMALRPVNVLFLDDNPSNLGEAKHFLPDLQIGGPEVIPELISQVSKLEKKDLKHKRLNQYKILEKKDIASKSFPNSEEFLYDSHIRVQIHHDCLTQIQRIHELILRSNQLNYTKKRINIEELESILTKPSFDCGYVTVKDRFGDYGIVGFYAKSGTRLEHFLFSCRTMGQKIEQWVYSQLGFPDLDVVGEVRTQLNITECPGWINQSGVEDEPNITETISDSHCRILLKGPCDLSHSFVYIKGSGTFNTEFSYVNEQNGQVIDAYNHSVHIEGLYTYSEKEKEDITQDCIFIDPKMLSGSFFTNDYDVIFLSTLIESARLIYKKKGEDLRVAFGGNDLTDPKEWEGLTNNTLYTGGNTFTQEYLRTFSEKYECIGITTPEMYVSFLEKCLHWLPEKTHLCLILGATKLFRGAEGQKQRHRNLNEAILAFAKENPRIKCIELDDCIHDSSDFVDGLNHFSARVYYELAQRMIQIIQSVTGKSIKSYSSRIVIIDKWILGIRKVLKKWVRNDSAIYKKMKAFYNRIYKQRD